MCGTRLPDLVTSVTLGKRNQGGTQDKGTGHWPSGIGNVTAPRRVQQQGNASSPWPRASPTCQWCCEGWLHTTTARLPKAVLPLARSRTHALAARHSVQLKTAAVVNASDRVNLWCCTPLHTTHRAALAAVLKLHAHACQPRQSSPRHSECSAELGAARATAATTPAPARAAHASQHHSLRLQLRW